MVDISIAITMSALVFMLTVIWGGPLIRVLRHFKIGKIIRIEGPASHMVKMGLPTMGGVLFILPVLMITGLWNAVALLGLDLLGRSVLLPMLVMVAFALLGAVDDWEGIRGPRRGLGMRARTKFLIQVIFAVAVAITLYALHLPQLYWISDHSEMNLGLWYIPIAAILIVAEANAVNFTDGLDGLSGLICVTAFVAYGVIAVSMGLTFLGRFCFALVGALFGFLWFNVHPSQMIMGDTGSMALGSVLAVVALMTGQWLLLPLIAIIPLAELLSVIIQVGYFRLTKGKRFFRMAPIHHHFELLGWSETQIVQRFWLISLLAAMLGLALAVN